MQFCKLYTAILCKRFKLVLSSYFAHFFCTFVKLFFTHCVILFYLCSAFCNFSLLHSSFVKSSHHNFHRATPDFFDPRFRTTGVFVGHPPLPKIPHDHKQTKVGQQLSTKGWRREQAEGPVRVGVNAGWRASRNVPRRDAGDDVENRLWGRDCDGESKRCGLPHISHAALDHSSYCGWNNEGRAECAYKPYNRTDWQRPSRDAATNREVRQSRTFYGLTNFQTTFFDIS